MYIVRGELIIKGDQERVSGQYGLKTVNKSGAEITIITDSPNQLEKSVRDLQDQGLLSRDAAVEHITSPEQADRYGTGSHTQGVYVAQPEKLNLTETMQGEVPAGAELESGYGTLWHETRVPNKELHFLAHNVLLETVQYDTETGWQPIDNSSPFAKTEVGILPYITFYQREE